MRKIIAANLSKKILLSSFCCAILVWSIDAALQVLRNPQTTFIESLSSPSTHDLYTLLLLWVILSLMIVAISQNRIIQEQRAQVENIFNNVFPICITNLNYEIVTANDAYWSIWGRGKKTPLKCYEHRPGKYCHTKKCALTQIANEAPKYTCESLRNQNGEERHFLVTVTPYLDSENKIAGIVESFEDITQRQKLEKENENLIVNLQESLQKVKLLSGFLPICASCKSIKDDKGLWSKVETYIANHSEATCSHGICPECAERLYPEICSSIKEKNCTS